MIKRLSVTILCFTLCIGIVQSQDSDKVKLSKASFSLMLSKLFMEFGYYEEARQQAFKAAALLPADEGIKNEAVVLLKQSLLQIEKGKKEQADRTSQAKNQAYEKELRKQKILIAEARRYLKIKNYQKASELLLSVIDKTDDPDIMAAAGELLTQTHPSGFTSYVNDIISAVLPVIIGILLLGILVAVFKFLRFFWTRAKNKAWRILEIKDNTNLTVDRLIIDYIYNLQDFVISSGKNGESKFAGLLCLNQCDKMITAIPNIDYTPPEIRLLPVLESMQFQLGTFNISFIAKFFGAINRWFNAERPYIMGMVNLVDKKIIVSFTIKNAKGRLYAVNASSKEDYSFDDIKDTVESACFKLLYLMLQFEKQPLKGDRQNVS